MRLAIPLLVLSFVASPIRVLASSTCALPPESCSGAAPDYGCNGGSRAILLGSGDFTNVCRSPLPSFSFNLITTDYEYSCSGRTGAPGCPDATGPPPLRFWVFDDYATANSGCEQMDDYSPPDSAYYSWLINTGVDLPYTAAGHWVLDQSSFAGLGIGADGGPLDRAVAELSFVDATVESTVDHRSWYAIASAPFDGTVFDFTRVQGASSISFLACSDADLTVLPVSGVSVDGRTGDDCRGNSITLLATPNAVDPSYMDTNIRLDEPNPLWLTENGVEGAPQLIAGYQIVYAASNDEPTTSDPVAGDWRPVHDPSDPSRQLGIVPIRVGGSVDVSVPHSLGLHVWLAARLVYSDATVNPTGTWAPAGLLSDRPRLYSPVSSHCGPVSGDLIPCDCFIQVDLLGPEPLCAGDSVTVEAADVQRGCDDTCLEYRCSWLRDGVPLATTDCSLTETVLATTEYEVVLSCVLDDNPLPNSCLYINGKAELTITVGPDVASGVGNTLRLWRQQSDPTDLFARWEPTGDDSYVVRRHDHPAFERALSQVIATSEHNDTSVRLGAEMARTTDDSYQVFAVGCDGLEGP